MCLEACGFLRLIPTLSLPSPFQGEACRPRRFPTPVGGFPEWAPPGAVATHWVPRLRCL